MEMVGRAGMSLFAGNISPTTGDFLILVFLMGFPVPTLPFSVLFHGRSKDRGFSHTAPQGYWLGRRHRPEASIASGQGPAWQEEDKGAPGMGVSVCVCDPAQIIYSISL